MVASTQTVTSTTPIAYTSTFWHILYIDMYGELKELINPFSLDERGQTLTARDILEKLHIEAQEYVAEIVRKVG